jgi:hypothetical protein
MESRYWRERKTPIAWAASGRMRAMYESVQPKVTIIE